MTISIQQFNMCMSDDETMEKEKASNFDACKLIYRCVELEVLRKHLKYMIFIINFSILTTEIDHFSLCFGCR